MARKEADDVGSASIFRKKKRKLNASSIRYLRARHNHRAKRATSGKGKHENKLAVALKKPPPDDVNSNGQVQKKKQENSLLLSVGGSKNSFTNQEKVLDFTSAGGSDHSVVSSIKKKKKLNPSSVRYFRSRYNEKNKHMTANEITEKTSSLRSKNPRQCDNNWRKLAPELEKGNPRKRKKVSPKLVPESKHAKKEIWFDNVSEDDLKLAEGMLGDKCDGSLATDKSGTKLIKDKAFGGITKAVGIDCEMVGAGKKGSRSLLARVSIVNQYGKCIYDKHVKVREKITDYRTWVSGIRPSDLKGAEDFQSVQLEVAEVLKDRILVGHAIHNDLKALYLSHPKKLIRDTSNYPPFRAHNNGKTPSLRLLSEKLLGIKVQGGEHSSVQDAQATMKLYMTYKRQWEKDLKMQKYELSRTHQSKG